VKKRLAENNQFRHEGVFSLTVNLKLLLILFAVFLFTALPSWAGMNQWTSIGPYVGNRPYGGYVLSLAVSPNYANDRTVFTGTANGVYKSTNGGASWIQINNGLPSGHGGVNSLAISPNYAADDTIFAGGLMEEGFYKSTNGGESWTHVNTGLTTHLDSFAFSPNYATDGTVFGGTWDGGVYKSTDNGNSWTQVITGLTNTNVIALAISPNFLTDGTVFAGTGYDGVYKTTDSGQSWTSVNSGGPAGMRTFSLAISPNYATDGTVFAGTMDGGVYKSTNSGAGWTQVNTGLTNTYVLSLAVSPNYANDSTLFAGTGNGVYKSNNGGASWTSINVPTLNPNVNSLAISPNYATDSTVFSTSADDGTYKSTNGGSSWILVDGVLTGASVESLAISPNFAIDRTLFAGTLITDGRVHKSINGGASWTQANSGLPSNSGVESIAISPNYSNDNTVFAKAGDGIYKSTNGSTSWTQVYAYTYGGLLVGLPVFSPNYATDNTLFAGAPGSNGGLYKSTDGGTSWAKVNSDFPSTYVFGYMLAISPNFATDNTLLARIDCEGATGSLYKSTNGGTNWTQVAYTYGGSLPVFSPNFANDGTLFAVFGGGVSDAGVYKSTDGGTTWTKVNSGFSSPFVFSLAISPNFANDSTLFAGTEGGVYRSTNGGASWTQVNSGLESIYARLLAISPNYATDNTLFAGTYGGGVFSYTSQDIYLLPRTGQTTSYAAGDDGAIQAGVAWPSPRFTDNGDQTITDRLTGLMWTKDAGTPTVGACSGGTKTWQDALDYVACLNSNEYLGHNDWRLPNINELKSLVKADQANLYTWLGAQGFTNVQAEFYWSSSTYAIDTIGAWLIHMCLGYVNFNVVKSYSFYVWPVRDEQHGIISLPKTGQTTSYAAGDDGAIKAGVEWPSQRFVDSGDQTITDKLTGLMWTKDSDAPGPSACNPETTKTWQAALNYVACLNSNNYLGHNDWRLPNINELKSLINVGQTNSASYLTTEGFTNVQPDYYWTSTSVATDTAHAIGTNRAWGVSLWTGYVENGNKDSSGDLLYVWPVRGGTVTGGGDTTPPTTTASPSGGTYSSTQNVTLTCNDGGGSGCQTTYYCLGTDCTPTTVYSGAINIASSTILRFYSTDNANNSESTKTETYTIILPPVTHTITASAVGANGSISPSGAVSVNDGDTKNFTVTPATDYIAVMSGTCGGNLVGNTYTTNPIIKDCSVTANFNRPGSGQSLEVQVPVSLPSGGSATVNVSFTQVTSGGTLSIAATNTAPAGQPSGFKFLGTYYNVTFTGSFSGYIYITFPYDASSIPSGSEGSLKLYHWSTSGGWEDCTAPPVDTANNRITGRVTSLSPFGIGYSTSSGGNPPAPAPPAPPRYSTGANEDMIALITILAISAGVFILRKNRWLRKV